MSMVISFISAAGKKGKKGKRASSIALASAQRGNFKKKKE